MTSPAAPTETTPPPDVAVSPGVGFGPAGEGYLRLALVENEHRLRQAVRQIARCLNRESKLKGYGEKAKAGMTNDQ